MLNPLVDLGKAYMKEKKPAKPKMVDVFDGCKCKKKALKKTAKKGKKGKR